MDPFTVFAVSFAERAAMRFGGQQLADQVASLVDLERAEVALLKEISKKVDALLAGPFHAGMRFLDDAAATWRTDADARDLLRQARISFTEALGQDDDHLRRSYAALHLAVVWAVLGSDPDTRVRLREAHREAVLAARELSRRATKWERVTQSKPLELLKDFNEAQREYIASTGGAFDSMAKSGERLMNHLQREWEKQDRRNSRSVQRTFGTLPSYIDALAAMRIAVGDDAATVPRYRADGKHFVCISKAPDF